MKTALLLIGMGWCQSVVAQNSGIPAKFEIASIKPSEGKQGTIMKSPPGRFEAVSVTLQFLITTAFELPARKIVGAPDWLSTDRFSVDAVASTTPIDPPPSTADMNHMLQLLLADRCRLKTHREVRDLPVMELVATKLSPKVRQNEGEPYQIRRGLGGIAFQKVTMARLADELSGRFASDEVDRTIVDRTGLTEDFNFTLEWSPGAVSSNPNSPTIFSALRDLGLSLKPAKDPLEVLVIDHVEKPSAN